MDKDEIRKQVNLYLIWRLEGSKKKFDKDLFFNFFCIDTDGIDVYVKNHKTSQEFRLTMNFPEIIEVYY